LNLFEISRLLIGLAVFSYKPTSQKSLKIVKGETMILIFDLTSFLKIPYLLVLIAAYYVIIPIEPKFGVSL